MKNTIALIILVGLLTGCNQESDSRAFLESASSTEFGSDQYACAETLYVAKAAGYDYTKLVDGCLRRRAKDLHSLFWLSKHAGFDAASAQGNATVLGMLLRRLGDDSFGRCLLKEPQEIQAQVHGYLLYDFGWGNDDSITIPLLKEWYPMALGNCEVTAAK